MELQSCPICLEHIKEEEQSILNCNHIFCKKCIDEYIHKKKNTCPLCRGEIKNYSYQGNLYNFIYTPIERIIENNINPTITTLNQRFRRYTCISFAAITSLFFMLNYRTNQALFYYHQYQDCNSNQTHLLNYIHSLEDKNNIQAKTLLKH
jgi:hypothetical protein